MIEVQNLTKVYGATRSISDVSFTVDQGEVLGFLGPNGAGKSTTMRMLVGLLRPTSGTARISGFDIQRDNEKIRNIIGYLPEAAPLYPDMTLAGYLVYMAGLKGIGSRDAKREMERTTAAVNLQKERKRLLRNLSKGTRQRAAIAQSLLGDPKVLILDEPTVGLDPSQINDVRELIKSMRGKRTVILSTHILPEVELTCSRIVIISAGNLVAEGTASELVQNERSGFAIEVEGPYDKLKTILGDQFGSGKVSLEKNGASIHAKISTAPDRDARAGLAKLLVDSGYKLMEFKVDEPRLEDVFLRAIGRRKDRES